MTYEVVMPQLGLTMEEGAVVSWQKKLGDWVKKGEVLFVVETDKTEMEVESSDSGYLTSIQVEVGKKVRVGTVIATLGDQTGEVASALPPSAPAIGASTAAAVPSEPNSKVAANEPLDSTDARANESPSQSMPSEENAASPRARRLAKELGIDIRAVRPARGKRIVEEDVRRHHESRKPGAAQIDGAEDS